MSSPYNLSQVADEITMILKQHNARGIMHLTQATNKIQQALLEALNGLQMDFYTFSDKVIKSVTSCCVCYRARGFTECPESGQQNKKKISLDNLIVSFLCTSHSFVYVFTAMHNHSLPPPSLYDLGHLRQKKSRDKGLTYLIAKVRWHPAIHFCYSRTFFLYSHAEGAPLREHV